MKITAFSFLAIILLHLNLSGQDLIISPKPPTVNTKYTVVDGNNTFAFELFAKVGGENDNKFISPFSISAALAMTYAGAKTETEKQMSNVLHFSLDQKSFHKEFKTLIDSLLKLSKKGLELKIANSLWIQKDYIFLKEYLDFANTYYKSGVKKTDFKNQTEKSRQEINKWVELQTNNKIKQLIKPNILNKLTRLVLVNAIYFNGTWDNPFDKQFTVTGDFYTAGKTSVKVPFMNRADQYMYYENDLFQLVDIPYKNQAISMIIMLPKKQDGLADLENYLNWKKFDEVSKSLLYEKVNIYLPKFEMTCEFELKEVLSAMGMPVPFCLEADFSGITGTKDLMIDKVIHKTFINVNETGTEVAGSTAVVLIEKSGLPKKPIEFKADHPFVFAIKDNVNNCILFLGRVSNPAVK
jgi:serpin B